jgi:hypothetical protein
LHPVAVISSSASRAAVTGIRAVNFIGRIVSFKLGAKFIAQKGEAFESEVSALALIVMAYVPT